jgi:hypothetical protein
MGRGIRVTSGFTNDELCGVRRWSINDGASEACEAQEVGTMSTPHLA